MPNHDNVLTFSPRTSRTHPTIEIALGPQAGVPAALHVRPDQILAGRVIGEMTRGWSPFERKAVSEAVAEGVLLGRTTADIVRRLRVPKPRNAAAVVHSAAMSVSAQLREALARGQF